MMKKRNAFAALLLLASGMAVSTLPASAQADWPNRPIRLIVPLGAGGSGDTLARVVADHLSNVFKQQFVVENRTGAGGLIGTQAIAGGRLHDRHHQPLDDVADPGDQPVRAV
jgi:tripartite-type tricarboxylate transporter receptor subunit TctC